jgi:hypothetical protein
VSVPNLQPGLVVAYSYLWASEDAQGVEEGRKDRPCAIVAARQFIDGREVATVVPITHSPPTHADDAVEIPVAIKVHLGLDTERSWVVVSEVNDFFWPGPDLRPISREQPQRFDYGILPPRFFAYLKERLLAAHLHKRLARIRRTE